MSVELWFLGGNFEVLPKTVCRNGGSCQDEVDGYECDCPPGLTGDYTLCTEMEGRKTALCCHTHI